jgi:hypothetical protein
MQNFLMINRPIPIRARRLFFADGGLQLTDNIPAVTCVAPRFLPTGIPSYQRSYKSHAQITACTSNYTVDGVRD